jgi:hypothetical protein
MISWSIVMIYRPIWALRRQPGVNYKPEEKSKEELWADEWMTRISGIIMLLVTIAFGVVVF